MGFKLKKKNTEILQTHSLNQTYNGIETIAYNGDNISCEGLNQTYNGIETYLQCLLLLLCLLV